MLTFQGQYTLFQDLAIDTTSASLTFAKVQINMGQRLLETEIGSHVMEDTRTGTTPTSTNVIELPENCIRVKAFYVTVGTTQYNAEEIYDEDTWRRIQSNTQSSTSDYVRYFFNRNSTLEMFPKAASENTYTMIYEAISKDMQYDDYITGTITTLANGGTTVTGSSTTWTSAMIGRYFKINADPQWYKIATVPTTTSLTLVKPYQGTAISAGTSSYTIGEMPRTPETTHQIPVYYALWHYFEGYKKDKDTGLTWKALYDEQTRWAKTTYSRRYSSQVIPNQRHLKQRVGLLDPNDWPNIT